MLQYFISTTETVVVAAVLTGMLLGYTWKRYGPRGRKTVLIGALVGLVLAAVLAWMKNKTKLIDTGFWNIVTFSVILLALVLLIVPPEMASSPRSVVSALPPAAFTAPPVMVMVLLACE